MDITNTSSIEKKDILPAFTRKKDKREKLIVLAGNPNVGKSTIFNALTGMNQHTGNWPGKTVSCRKGCCHFGNHSYVMVDIPGTYSLKARSCEEEAARDFLCFGHPDVVIVVCDATCLERNMNLVLQTLEITSRVIVCINLMDEARRKQIHIDLQELSRRLGVPVVGTNARKKESLHQLLEVLNQLTDGKISCHPVKTRYPKRIEQAVSMLEPLLTEKQNAVTEKTGRTDQKLNERWLSLRLLERDEGLIRHLVRQSEWNYLTDSEIRQSLQMADRYLVHESISPERWDDSITASLISHSEKIIRGTIIYKKKGYHSFDQRLDRLLTGRFSSFPIMIVMLCGLFWLTIVGSNYPSRLLSEGMLLLQDQLSLFLYKVPIPLWLHDMLILGLFRVVAWVVSVMLPPMAIFFPLFTLMEDSGLLPRIAYNLDKPFQQCHACGKQCLSMAMGLGCNAVGVTGCRIIDSPRERLLAILTNSMIPCNGRFPAMISVILMFFAGSFSRQYSSLIAAMMLTGLILLAIIMTLLITRLLSATLLKGLPSAFTLELPPYRRPQIGKIIVRSVFDRTLFVLGRAVCAAAPAGILLWIMANISFQGNTLLYTVSSWLNPAAHLIGLDGVILIAFILGFPANEIVLPIMVMGYTSQNTISQGVSLLDMYQIFAAHGWTTATAVCVLVFILMHWPCSTTLLTIKKETASLKWTAAAAVIPALCGIFLCFFLNLFMEIFRIL